MPPGKIIIDDNFSIEDVFHIKNDLHIDLTFSSIREIKSFYTFQIDEFEKLTCLMEINVNVKKNTTWIEVILYKMYNSTKFIFFKFLIKRTNQRNT